MSKQHPIHLIRLLFLCGVFATLNGALAQENKTSDDEKEKDPLIGRRVMTTVWGAELKLGKDVVGIVELGKVFTIDGANGK